MQLLAVVGCRQYGVSTETPLELAMPLSSIEYYDQAALLDRLTMGIKNSGESVVFLVGSAVTAPLQIGGAGVPNVQGVIDLIKKQFPAEQTAAFEREIQQSPQPYQAAFSYLIGRRGQTAANNIIKRAVMMARLDACASAANLSDADCDNLDQGNENWFLNPAVKSLGRLVALQPEKFGQTISDVAHALYASATPGEFSRVARKLFRKIDWNDWARYKSFDHVFDRHFRILVNLSREGEYAELLERYAATMPVKDARYINYCALKSNMHWTRSEFPEAVKWAEIGKDLKDRTNVDTRYSTDHELALAQRDVGRPELAIKLFLGNVDLDTVLDPDEFDEEKGESFRRPLFAFDGPD